MNFAVENATGEVEVRCIACNQDFKVDADRVRKLVREGMSFLESDERGTLGKPFHSLSLNYCNRLEYQPFVLRQIICSQSTSHPPLPLTFPYPTVISSYFRFTPTPLSSPDPTFNILRTQPGYLPPFVSVLCFLHLSPSEPPYPSCYPGRMEQTPRARSGSQSRRRRAEGRG